MKKMLLFASVSVASGVLFLNVYTSMIDAKSWGSDMPHSIATAREYFKTVNPGNYFRIFSPLNQLLGLLSLIFFWRSSRSIRLFLAIAFVMYALAEMLTFKYFYPRNDIMFKTAQLTDIDTLKRVWGEWVSMNWVRSFIVFVGLSCSYVSLHKIYTLNKN
ncbi:MAG: DUF1772 domain-containing protein [Ferruginibacter sp.]